MLLLATFYMFLKDMLVQSTFWLLLSHIELCVHLSRQEMEIEELKEKLSSGIPREMAVLEERLEATGRDGGDGGCHEAGRLLFSKYDSYDQELFFLGTHKPISFVWEHSNSCSLKKNLLNPVDANARSISRTSL